jgi:hypothetical protein
MKYHLGCGSHYLAGYINVDFPLTEHTVNNEVKADLYQDIIKMKYDPCDEIRSHHFFEHFNFIDSFVLLYKWTMALNIGGTLIIDVPDLEALCKAYLNPSLTVKFRVARYLYGSHEANWAHHINGWSKESLEFILTVFGYKIDSFYNYGDPNAEYPNCGVCLNAKLVSKYGATNIRDALLALFGNYKNGDTDFENRLVEFYKSEFNNKIDLQ